MSTNFDWIVAGREGRHIGKRVRYEDGLCAFIWAYDPVETMILIFKLNGEPPIAKDEYGTVYTPQELQEVIEECRQRYELVGEEFS